MQVTPIQRETHKQMVRNIMIFNPSMPILQIEERLKETHTPLSRPYITDLCEEIRRERLEKVTEETKEEVIGKMEDLVEYINNQLRAIAQEEKLVYTKKTKDGAPAEAPETRIFAQSNRIKALVEIVKNTERLTNLKMDLGVLERKIGISDVRVLDILSAVKYFKQHGLNGIPEAGAKGNNNDGEGAPAEDGQRTAEVSNIA